MKKGWYKKTIGVLCLEGGGNIQTGPFGSQLHQSDYSEHGIPVVMPADIPTGKISLGRIARVNESHVQRLSRHKLLKGDIVYGRRGDIGRQALVGEENVGWLCGTGCLRIRLSQSEVRPDYLHRYLTLPEIIGWIEGQAIGATMPNLNTDILSRVVVHYPSLDAQRKIAAILTAYDELIENNKRRIALLEKMAEELYREWFVRMRFPGYQNAKFVKGVPEAWNRLPIGELTSFLSRGVFPKYSDRSQRIVINQRCIRDGTIDLSNAKTHETTIPEKKLLKRGDVLINSTGVGTLGRSAVLWETTKDLTCDSHITICRANHKKVVPLFIGFSIQLLHSYFDQLAVGSTGQTELNRSFIAMTKILVPEKELQNKFEAEATPIVSFACKLRAASRVLTQTRDLLLPRLISGKLPVDDLDIQFPPSMREEAG